MQNDLIFQSVVEGIASNGCGVARCGDEVFFVRGAAPREKIICRKNPQEKHGAELIEIIEVSPDRTDPRCPYYGECGGCSLRHIHYEAQLREKRTMLRAAFLHTGGTGQIPEIEVVASPPDAYRDRVQLHRTVMPGDKMQRYKLGGKTPTPPFGFMARDSNRIIPVKDCYVLNETLRAALREDKIKPPLDKDRFNLYGKDGVLLCEGGKTRGTFAFRAGEFTEKLTVDAGLFFQSNGILLEQLIRRVLEAAGGAPSNLPAGDFYCGVGTFAVFLRRLFPQLDLLEENRAACALARENLARAGGITEDCRFFAMTDTAWAKQERAGRRYGFLCADPARQGLSPPLRRWLCTHRPAVFAYISCEPSALARDSRELLAAGFNLSSLTLYDFYPQTPHIETLAVFNRA